MGRPASSNGRRGTCNQLRERRRTAVRLVHGTFSIRDDVQAGDCVTKRIGGHAKLRTPRPDDVGFRNEMLFDDEVPARLEDALQCVDQRQVGVADHDGQIVAIGHEEIRGSMRCIFQIRLDARDGQVFRVCRFAQAIERDLRDIDRIDLPTSSREVDGIASGAAGHVDGSWMSLPRLQFGQPFRQQRAWMAAGGIGAFAIPQVPLVLVRPAHPGEPVPAIIYSSCAADSSPASESFSSSALASSSLPSGSSSGGPLDAASVLSCTSFSRVVSLTGFTVYSATLK